MAGSNHDVRFFCGASNSRLVAFVRQASKRQFTEMAMLLNIRLYATIATIFHANPHVAIALEYRVESDDRWMAQTMYQLVFVTRDLSHLLVLLETHFTSR